MATLSQKYAAAIKELGFLYANNTSVKTDGRETVEPDNIFEEMIGVIVDEIGHDNIILPDVLKAVAAHHKTCIDEAVKDTLEAASSKTSA